MFLLCVVFGKLFKWNPLRLSVPVIKAISVISMKNFNKLAFNIIKIKVSESGKLIDFSLSHEQWRFQC